MLILQNGEGNEENSTMMGKYVSLQDSISFSNSFSLQLELCKNLLNMQAVYISQWTMENDKQKRQWKARKAPLIEVIVFKLVLKYLKWECNPVPSFQTALKPIWGILFWENSSIHDLGKCVEMHRPPSSVIPFLWKEGFSMQSEKRCCKNIFLSLLQLMLETTYRPCSASVFFFLLGNIQTASLTVKHSYIKLHRWFQTWVKMAPASINKEDMNTRDQVPSPFGIHVSFVLFSSADLFYCCPAPTYHLIASQSFFYSAADKQIWHPGNSSMHCLTW